MGYFLRSMNVLNILLAGVIALMVQYLIMPVAYKDAGYVPSKRAAAEQNENEETAESEALGALDYRTIADKNLFHPERKIPVEKPAGEAAPPPKPEFVLYGTTILDEQGIVYIEDKKAPQSTPGRGRRVSIIRKGDSLSGFVLTDIRRDNVIMVRGDEKITVSLNEPKERTGGQPSAAGGPPSTPQRARQAPAVQKR